MKQIDVKQKVLNRHQEVAQQLCRRFDSAAVLAINIMGSPGCGKTALLEIAASRLADSCRTVVLEGDLQTDNDAQRVCAAGLRAYQINTDSACHLDALMVERSLKLNKINLDDLDLLVIENVGNLVCPAGFDLGEHCRIVMSSLPEGFDKPAKYPRMFYKADCVLLNKIDLLGVLDFDKDAFWRFVEQVAPKAARFEISCKTGTGTDAWLDWLRQRKRSPSETRD
ncbi:MAG: hydrogenase nickel incorporation protein HypB [Actinobacteria bacterium]|nr:hydrogenase nickel incorporation protein HypB [Actinomycetota bacterium]